MKNTVLKFLTLAAAVCGMSAWGVIETQADLDTAISEAKGPVTIELGENTFTLYGKEIAQGKTITFVGLGKDKTVWEIGGPASDGSGYPNADYSFVGSSVTFRNLKLTTKYMRGYQGFAQSDNTSVENCLVVGTTFYWGYKTATFRNTEFQTSGDNYAMWVYQASSDYVPVITFDTCVFNCDYKCLHLYNEGTPSKGAKVIIKDCEFNNLQVKDKPALNVKDANQAYSIYFLGNNSGSNLKTGANGSAMLQFNGAKAKVYCGADEESAVLIWENGAATDDWMKPEDYVPAAAAAEETVAVAESVTAKDKAGNAVDAADVVTAARTEVAANTTAAKAADTGVTEIGSASAMATALKAQAAADAVKESITAESTFEKYVSVTLQSVVVAGETPAFAGLVYDVKPMVKTTVTVDSVETTVTADIPASEVTGAITFRLPVTDDFTKSARVAHTGDPDRLLAIEGTAGQKYVTVTATHFSPFTVYPDTQVESVVTAPNVLAVKRVPGGSKAEVVAAVPWKNVALTGNITVDQLIATGVAEGDEIAAWDGASKAYYTWRYIGTAWEAATDAKTNVTAPAASAYTLARGQAVWYKRGTPSAAYSQIGGYTEESVTTVVAAGGATTANPPANNLLINPYYQAVDLKQIAGVAGDQIMIVSSKKVYTCKNGKWGTIKLVETETPFGTMKKQQFVEEAGAITLPAGEGFWYISKGGQPTIDWKALVPSAD